MGGDSDWGDIDNTDTMRDKTGKEIRKINRDYKRHRGCMWESS